MDDYLVRRAWERFIERGHVDAAVRGTVLASWTRSLEQHVSADRSATAALSEGELHRRRQAGSRLIAAAQSALQQARSLLSQSYGMLILTDHDGAVLESAGDRGTIEYGHGIGLRTGGLWSEDQIGTNAIGTALATGAPVRIHASEHFCSRVQQWSCAAAPVRDPIDGHVLGVVDVSSRPNAAGQRDLAYAVSVAQQIEAILNYRQDAENASILRRFLQRRADWHSDGLLAVNSSGGIVHATDMARRRLELAGHDLIKDGTLAPLARKPQERWQALLRRRLPSSEMELITEHGQGIGAIIVLPEHRPGRRNGRVQRTQTPAASARRAAAEDGLKALIGDSPAMREAREKALRLAQVADAPILIEGETGVGKELFARAIHRLATPQGPFVPVNCGGLPRDLIGSEIFGYVRGAFTGADSGGHPGKMEAAADGTLCLDEIGEMPLELQPYLLRVLEDGMVYRIGSHQPLQVRTRVVSMTNRDLLSEAQQGRFRDDLFYRIAVLRLRIPPLRDRGDDIVALVEHFALKAAARGDMPPPRFTPQAMEQLRRHHWPGNVRQLRNVVDTLVYLAGQRHVTVDDLPAEVLGIPAAPPAGDLRSVERDAIVGALRSCHGNITQAARTLGIARSTLYCMIDRMKIPV